MSLDNSFWLGEVAVLTIAVTDLDGDAADPGAITLKMRPPSGTVASYPYGSAPELSRTGVGAYRAEIPLGSAGLWAYRWELTSPNAGACEGVISVQKSRVV